MQTIMEGVLVVKECARTPSEPCQGTLEQGTKPTIAHIGLCDESRGGPSVYPSRDLERDKVVKKMS